MNAPRTIRALLIEDSEDDALLLIAALQRGGFAPDWQRVETEAALRTALPARPWDIVFCDYSMAQFDARAALSVIRESGHSVPLIVISGTIGEEIAVEMLQLGVNDHLLKQNLTRLIPAVERALREEQLALERRNTERFHRLMMDRSLDIICTTDGTGHIMGVSRATERILGYPQEELIGRKTLEFIFPEDHKKTLQTRFQIMEGRTVLDFENRWLRKDGGVAHLMWSSSWSVADQAFFSVGRDMTERKCLDAELHLLRTCVGRISDIVLITEAGPLDEPGPRVVFVNEAFTRLTGYTLEETLGRSPRFLQGQKTDRAALDRIRTALVEGKPVREELINYTKDAEELCLELDIAPVADAAGRLTHFVAIERDVTVRKAAEAVIREQAALLDCARDAILVQDLEGHLQYWNQSAERVFGWTAEEALGRKMQELLYERQEAYRLSMEAVLRKGEWIGEVTARAKDGRHVLIEGRWTLVRDGAGLPTGILAINTDITDRRALEAQFFRAQRIESTGMLAGGIAHDLNNILGPIIISAELLRMHADRPPNPELLETIKLSAARGAEMVKHVLSFAGGIEGRRAMVRPADLFAELWKIIRETFPKTMEVRTDVAETVWNVGGDPTQLHQVLLNLAVNARDAMSAGGTLTFAARNVEIDEQFAAMQDGAHAGPYVVLEVADTGTGIPAGMLEKIFEPFFTTKAHGRGTGLGLSTCAAIVKSHGGFLTVESQPGVGTVFRIHLPACPESDEVEEPAAASELPRGNGEIVLVIDDEAALRSITRQTLETFGYRVMTAADGAEGVALFAQHGARIALVLTDLLMPVMDGAAAARVILRLDPAAQIIGTTGDATKSAETGFANAGVQHFLPKPYTAEALLKLIHAILHRGNPEAGWVLRMLRPR